MHYRGGIIRGSVNCPGAINDLDHAVLIVGYGVENGVKYWLIKNSWSESWGEDGFFRFERGTSTCGVNNAVSWQR